MGRRGTVVTIRDSSYEIRAEYIATVVLRRWKCCDVNIRSTRITRFQQIFVFSKVIMSKLRSHCRKLQQCETLCSLVPGLYFSLYSLEQETWMTSQMTRSLTCQGGRYSEQHLYSLRAHGQFLLLYSRYRKATRWDNARLFHVPSLWFTSSRRLILSRLLIKSRTVSRTEGTGNACKLLDGRRESFAVVQRQHARL